MKKQLLLVALVAATLAVGAQTQVPVLIEGFDGSGLPAGWTLIDADNDADNWTHSSAFPNAYYAVPTHNSSAGSLYSASIDVQSYDPLTPDNWLVSPQVSLSGSSSLTYWMRISSGYYPGDHYGVFITTVSNPAPSDFTQLFVETMTGNDEAWGMRTVNLDSYAGQTVRIAFRHFNCTDGDILILDDVTVLTTSASPMLSVTPAALDFGTVAVGSASLPKSVTVSAFNVTGPVAASVASPFEISADGTNYGPTATLPDTGGTLSVRYVPTAVVTDSTVLTITGGGASQSVSLLGSGIDCSGIALPFFEGFESAELDPCWTVLFFGTSSVPVYGPQNEFASAGQQAFMMAPFYANSYDLYLITPELPVSGQKMVSFDHRGYFSDESFVVGYSTTTNDTAAFVWGPTVLSPANDEPWNHYQNVAVPGNARYIAVHHTSSDGLILFIDNFSVSEISSCIAPYDLAVGNVTSTSAELSWSHPSDSMDITLYYMSDADTSVVEVQGVALVDGVYTLDNLAPGMGYSWMLAVICDGDTLVSAVGTFTTPCEAVSQLPYTQDFDNTALNTLPDCWLQADPYNGFPKVTTLNAHSGNALEFRGNPYTSAPVYAVLPPFAADLSELQVNFWTRREGASSGTFMVGYLTDANDASTFVPVASFTSAQIGDNSYHFFNVPFDGIDSTPGINRYIAFRYETESNWYWHLDDVTVEEIPACPAPADLTATEVTDAAATLHWTGNGDSYNICYKRSSDTAWTILPGVLMSDSGYTLGGLDFNTTYQWYVVSVCGDLTTASYNTATFKTECGVYTAPFSETFDASVMPDCWSRYTGIADSVFNGAALAETTGGWVFDNDHVFGAHHAVLNIYGSSRNHWLVTPPIDLAALTNPNLTFDLALTDYNNANAIETPGGQSDDRFILMFSTDDGETWSADAAVVWSNDSSADYVYDQIPAAGQTVSLSLSDFVGQTIRIAFYGQSTVANGDNDLHIDNVAIGETPQCPAPTLLTVGELTSSTAALSWSANGGVTSWQVEYGIGHFDFGSGTAITVYDTPTVTLTGLQDNTLYTAYVTALCDGGVSSASPWVTFTTQMAPAALPYSTDFSATADRNWLLNNGEGRNRWHIGTAGTATALYITGDSLNTPQYDVSSTSIVSAIKTLAVGQADELLVSFDIRCGGEGQYDFVKLFLAPVAEEFPASTSTYSATYASATYSTNAFDFSDYLPYSGFQAHPYKFNLTGDSTVHIDAVMPNPNLSPDSGSVANLVFLWRNDFSSGTQPGAIITNVSVTAVTCRKPLNLLVGTVTESSAYLSWLAGGDETAWNIEYKPDTAEVWTAVPVTATNHTLTGLTPATAYSVRVQSDCGGGGLSIYAHGSFTTGTLVLADPTVETLPATDITTVSALLHGTVANPDQVPITSKGFEWKPQNAGYATVYVTDNADTMAYPLTGLAPSSTYTYRAFIVFGGDTLRGGELSFTTLPDDTPEPCDVPTGLAVSAVTDASIAITWDDHDGVDSWNIQYGVAGGTMNPATSNTNSYTIDGLQPETTYAIQVQADCGDGNVSGWSAAVTGTTTVGIDSWLSNSVVLYPNPATEVVKVQCTMHNAQLDGELQLLDVYGKLLQIVPVTAETVQINVSGLADGLYFVRVTTAAGVVTKTFVKR